MKRATPPTYKPNPLPRVLQAKSIKRDQPAGSALPVAPPAYRPQPTPKVLQKKSISSAQQKGKPILGQTVQAKASATRTTPAAPPVYRPQPTRGALQAKLIAIRGASAGNTVQLAEKPPKPSSNNKKQAKIKAAQAHNKKEKQRAKQKTVDNLVAYEGVDRQEAREAAESGVVVRGHHSRNNQSKQNNATTQDLATYHATKRENVASAKAERKRRDSDDEYVESGGEEEEDDDGGPSFEDLQDEAARAWNAAVDAHQDGMVAMAAYLAKRVQFQTISQEDADTILAIFAEDDPEERLPVG